MPDRFLSRLRPALALLFAALLLSGMPRGRAADPQSYTVAIAPTTLPGVDTAAHDAATLISLRTTAPVGPFALVARARDDRMRFLAVLHSFGHYDGTVTITIAGRSLDDPDLLRVLRDTPAATSVQVAVTLTPGRLFHLGRVTLNGNVPPDARAALKLAPGQPAVASDVLAARERLLTALRNSGHALATVAMPVAILHETSGTLDVSFAVDPGPRVDLGPIGITGQKHTNEAYIRRRLLIRQGEQYDPRAIETARQDLIGTGLFATVRIAPPDGLDAAGQLPMQVTVTELPLHVVQLGGAYSTDLGISLNASWTDRNLLGNGEKLTLSAAATELGGTAALQPGYNIGATLQFPDWLRRDQSLTLHALAEQQYLIAYDQTAAIIGADVTRRFTPELSGTVGISGEEESIRQEGVRRDYTLLQLPLSVNFDNTHDLLNPTHGVRANVSLTPTESFGNPTSTFVIAQASASTYLDITGNGRTVLALRGLIGGIEGASTFAVPADQRFYAGGSGTIRGFRFQSVGPQFPDGVPIGGTAIDTGSIELRQRFGTRYGAVVFADAGQVNDNNIPFEGTPQVGVGVGARYYTSFGPLRVDFAVPVTNQPHSGSFQVYIGIGQAF